MNNARALAIFTLLAAPFYLNDLANLWVADWRWWLAIDYAFVKLLPLAVAAWVLARGWMTPAELGLTRQRALPFAAAFLGAGLLGTLIDQNAYAALARLPGYPRLGGMPEIRSDAWNRFDLGVGLLLVGVVEELVFRGCACAVIRRFTANSAAIVAISAAAFGLIHWSLGLHTVLVTAAIGAVFMAIYLVTRSAPALMLAHFLVNYIDYAGVIPKSVFKFL